MSVVMVSALAGALNVCPLEVDVPLGGVKTDTRYLLKPGELFVALQGPNHDGHDYLQQAKDKGAVAAVVSRSVPAVDLPQWVVPDTLATLGQIGLFYRRKTTCPVIALTGTCGKTSVRTMLAHVLKHFGETLSNEANHNNQIGVPQTLVQLGSHHAFAAIECGTDHLGEIAILSAMVEPEIALITNVDAGHLQGIGSIGQVLEEKSSMLDYLKPNGTAILNADQPYLEHMQSRLGKGQSVLTFGLSDQAGVSAKEIRYDQHGCPAFMLTIGGRPAQRIQLPLPGDHQVVNALAVVAVCLVLDLPIQEVSGALASTPAVPHRLMRRRGLRGSVLLDDTYNANPRSFEAALKVLAAEKGKKLLVMGEMRELGPEEDRYHREVGELASGLKIDAVMAYGDLCQHTVEAFGAGATFFESREAIAKQLAVVLDKNWVVLVKGSHSTKMVEVVEAVLAEEQP